MLIMLARAIIDLHHEVRSAPQRRPAHRGLAAPLLVSPPPPPLPLVPSALPCRHCGEASAAGPLASRYRGDNDVTGRLLLPCGCAFHLLCRDAAGSPFACPACGVRSAPSRECFVAAEQESEGAPSELQAGESDSDATQLPSSPEDTDSGEEEEAEAELE